MNQPTRDTLYYDGACGMCQRSVAILRAIDWLDRLDARDTTQTPDDQLPVPREDALRGIPMRTRSGRTLLGFPAFRRALAQTPLGALPALLMYVPGISHAGNAVYNAVAERRARDAACDVCAPPDEEPQSSSSGS